MSALSSAFVLQPRWAAAPAATAAQLAVDGALPRAVCGGPRPHRLRPSPALLRSTAAAPPTGPGGCSRRAGAALAAGALLAAGSTPRRRQRRRHGFTAVAAAEGEPSLESVRGVDFAPLRDLLQNNDFKGADAETRRLIIALAGEAAVKRGWAFFAEVRTIPDTDMLTLDGLWKHYSKGRFGYSAQRKIWRQCREQFDKFAEQVSWFTDKWKNRNWPDEFVYTLDAPVGHLPLTNCIRGAQVLQELMSHSAFERTKAAAGSSQRSAVGMLAVDGGVSARASGGPGLLAGSWARRCAREPEAHRLRRASTGPSAAVAEPPAAAAAAAPAPTAAAAAAPPKLADLKEQNVISDIGFVLPEVPEGTQASAFCIFDATHKAQYIGFSKDLRNTLRTLLCRRPELCYYYKCANMQAADNAVLAQLRTEWVAELGGAPPGNREARQKGLWESPVDAGAVSERAFKTVAEQKAKQVLRQLKDRNLKENVDFNPELIAQGKVDALPSTLSTADVAQQAQQLNSRVSRIEKDVFGKQVSYEVFYTGEFVTKGGWWFDVEVTAAKTKSTHRVIVGKDFLQSVGATNPREVVENAFAVLLARKVPRKTEGLITSEVFPSNYFTVTNVAIQFPEFLELFGRKPDAYNWDSAQWNFKQVHDYSQDDKRTIPAGPLGGYFDPAGLQ